MFTFNQACHFAKQGKVVRRSEWETDLCLHWRNDRWWMSVKSIKGDEALYPLFVITAHDVISNDWLLAEQTIELDDIAP